MGYDLKQDKPILESITPIYSLEYYFLNDMRGECALCGVNMYVFITVDILLNFRQLMRIVLDKCVKSFSNILIHHCWNRMFIFRR